MKPCGRQRMEVHGGRKVFVPERGRGRSNQEPVKDVLVGCFDLTNPNVESNCKMDTGMRTRNRRPNQRS